MIITISLSESTTARQREIMAATTRRDRPPWTSMSHEDQLKEAAMAFIRLCAEQEGESPSQNHVAPPLDPYTKASVASGARPAFPVMVRHPQTERTLQPEPPGEPRAPKKLILKRKVLRRTPDGDRQVTDESVVSELESSSPSDPEYDDISQRNCQLNTKQEKGESDKESEASSSPDSEDPRSWRTVDESPSRSSPRDSESHSTPSYEQDLIIAGHPKSFIPPRLDQLSRNRMKTDRVARYLEHKHDWETLRLPGEDNRKGVRWSIREQMLYKTEFPARPQHVYIPNNYLVPTEKKRSALRWGIRCDLANGVIPRNSYSS